MLIDSVGGQHTQMAHTHYDMRLYFRADRRFPEPTGHPRLTDAQGARQVAHRGLVLVHPSLNVSLKVNRHFRVHTTNYNGRRFDCKQEK
jgi:hypothetical protein